MNYPADLHNGTSVLFLLEAATSDDDGGACVCLRVASQIYRTCMRAPNGLDAAVSPRRRGCAGALNGL